jgi:hypothetical protein
MDLGPLLLGFIPQLSQFETFFPDLDVVTEEEDSEQNAKSQEVKSDLEGLLVYSEVSSFGSLLAKDEDIKIVFIQNNLLVSPIHKFYWISGPLSTYQSEYCRVKFFFALFFLNFPPLGWKPRYLILSFNFH